MYEKSFLLTSLFLFNEGQQLTILLYFFIAKRKMNYWIFSEYWSLRQGHEFY